MATQELLRTCEDAARAGGKVLLEKWGTPRTIEFKGGPESDGSAGRRGGAEPRPTIDLVTDADEASERAVLGLIRERFPGDRALAEESGASGEAAAGRRWIVDPLDGTTNYAHGVPHFAVNVAVEDEQGLAAGATYDPLRDELFLAARGGGATLNGRPIRVSAAVSLKQSLLCTGFPYDIHEKPEVPLALFNAYMRRARAVRRMGAAALDLAYVACGRFDGFWELKLKPWDMAPGMLLVREAGGIVTDFAGGGDIFARAEIVASGPGLHPVLMEVLHEVRGGRLRD